MKWIGSNGERQMMPKDEGPVIMISEFQSRTFGFSFHEFTYDKLKRVNDYIYLSQNKHYKDRKASNEVLPINSSDQSKSKLEKYTNFVQYLEYGANKNGYWSYEHLITQIE